MQPLTVTSPYEKCRVGNLKGRGFVMASTYGRSQRDCRQRRKSKGYYQKLIIQKLMGLVLLAICGLAVEDRDCTAVVLFAPMAFYLLFAREIVIY